jgi:hypothetical protein
MTSTEQTTATEPSPADQTGQGEDERSVRRTVSREYRPRRTVPAVIVALVLAAASIVIAIEAITRLFNQPLGLLPVEALGDLGRETQWNDPLTVTVAIVAVLLGVVLLVLALTPGRVRARPLRSVRPGVAVAVAPGDLERLAAQAAETVAGVDHASARAGNGRVSVRADSPLHDPGNLDEQVQQAVSERLDQLGLLDEPQVRVSVRHRED